MVQRIKRESFNSMVDIVLAHNGTPRSKLFEYPHRDDDSRIMIAKAEDVVTGILSIVENELDLSGSLLR